VPRRSGAGGPPPLAAVARRGGRHFDAGGTPDRYVPKAVGVLLAPLIDLAAVGALRYAERVDPTADRRVLSLAVVFVDGLVAYLQGLVLAFNLGWAFSTTAALVPMFSEAAALVEYALYRDGTP
jgi:hypothetical protein